MTFDARVTVARLTATEGGPVVSYSAEVIVRCHDCHLDFEFVGLPMGASPVEPTTSADGLHARLPIVPHDNESLGEIAAAILRRAGLWLYGVRA